MRFANLFRASCRYFALGSALFSTVTNLVTPSLAAESKNPPTVTPIKHVIVIIGENRTFDQVLATYKAPAGQTVDNLLSQGIINAEGTPEATGLAQGVVDTRIANVYHLPDGPYPLTPSVPHDAYAGSPEVSVLNVRLNLTGDGREISCCEEIE
jgi:phospholipase C